MGRARTEGTQPQVPGLVWGENRRHIWEAWEPDILLYCLRGVTETPEVKGATNWPGLEANTRESNGNPLQCSCLENPRDGEAWWAAVYGVVQSWTRLKRLSSSSSNRGKYRQSRSRASRFPLRLRWDRGRPWLQSMVKPPRVGVWEPWKRR